MSDLSQKAFTAWNAGPGPALYDFYSEGLQQYSNWLGDSFYPIFGYDDFGLAAAAPVPSDATPKEAQYFAAAQSLSAQLNLLNTQIFDAERSIDGDDVGKLNNASWPGQNNDAEYWRNDVTPVFLSILQDIKVIQENILISAPDGFNNAFGSGPFAFGTSPPENLPELIENILDSAPGYLKLFPEYSVSLKADVKPVDDTIGLGPTPIFSDTNLEASLSVQGTGWPRTNKSHYIALSLPGKSSNFVEIPLRVAPFVDNLSMGWNDTNYSYINNGGQLKKSNSRDYKGVRIPLGTEIEVVEIISCKTGVWVGFVSDDSILNDLGYDVWNTITDFQRRVLYVKAQHVRIKENKIKSDPNPYVSEVSMMGDDASYQTRKLKGSETIKPYENQNWVKIEPSDVRLQYYSFNQHNLKLLGKGEEDNVRFNVDTLQKAETLRYSEGYFYFITAEAPRKTEKDIINESDTDIEESPQELDSAKDAAGTATISELKEVAWSNLLNYLGKNTIGGNLILINKLKEKYFVLADKKVVFSGNPNNQKALFCIKASYIDSIPDVRRAYGEDFEDTSSFFFGRNYAVALFANDIKERCDFIVKKLKIVKSKIEGSGAIIESAGGSEYDIQVQIDLMNSFPDIINNFLSRQSFPASMNKSYIYDMVQEGSKSTDDNIIQIGVKDNSEVGGKVRETISYVLFSPDPKKLRDASQKDSKLFNFDPYLSKDDLQKDLNLKRSAIPLRIALPHLRSKLEGEYGSRTLHLFLAHDKIKQTIANGESDLENNWMQFVSNYLVPPLRIYLSPDPALLDPEILDCDELIKKLNKSGSNVGYEERVLQEKLFNNPKCMEKYFEQYKDDTPATSPELGKKELEAKSEITEQGPNVDPNEFVSILYNQFFNVLDTDALIAMILACLSKEVGFDFTAEAICEQAIVTLVNSIGKDPVEKAMLANAFLSPDSEGSKKFIEYYMGEPPFTDMSDEELVDLGVGNPNLLLDDSFNDSPIATSMLMNDREPPAVIKLIKELEKSGAYVELEPGDRNLESQDVSIPYGSGLYDLFGVTESTEGQYGTYIVPEKYTQLEIEKEKQRLMMLGYSSDEARAMMVASGILKASPSQYEPLLNSGEWSSHASTTMRRGNLSGAVKFETVASAVEILNDTEQWLEYMKRLLGGISGLCELVVGDVLEGLKDLIKDPGAFFNGGAGNWSETFWEKIKKQFMPPSFSFKFPDNLGTDSHMGDYYAQLAKTILSMIAMILSQIINLLIKDALEKCLEEDKDVGPIGGPVNSAAPIPLGTLGRINFSNWPGIPGADLIAWVQDVMDTISTSQLCALLRGDATKSTLRTCLEITKERHPNVYQVRDPASGALIMSRVDTVYEVRIAFESIGKQIDLDICNVIDSPLPQPLVDNLCAAVFDRDARCEELLQAGLTEQECQDQIDKEIESLKNKVKGLTEMSLNSNNLFNPFDNALPTMCGDGGSFSVPPGVQDTMERVTDNMLTTLKGSLIVDLTNLKFFSLPPRALQAMTDPAKLKQAHDMFKDVLTNPYTKECLVLIGDSTNHKHRWEYYGSKDKLHRVYPLTYNKYIHYGNMSTWKARNTDLELAGITQEQTDEIKALRESAYNEAFDARVIELIDLYERNALQEEIDALLVDVNQQIHVLKTKINHPQTTGYKKAQLEEKLLIRKTYKNKLEKLKLDFAAEGVSFGSLFDTTITNGLEPVFRDAFKSLQLAYNNYVSSLQTVPPSPGGHPSELSNFYDSEIYEALLKSVGIVYEAGPHSAGLLAAQEAALQLTQEYLESYDPTQGSITTNVIEDLFYFDDPGISEQTTTYFNANDDSLKTITKDDNQILPMTTDLLWPKKSLFSEQTTATDRLELFLDVNTAESRNFVGSFFKPVLGIEGAGFDPAIWNPLLGYAKPSQVVNEDVDEVEYSTAEILNSYVEEQFQKETKPVGLEFLSIESKQIFSRTEGTYRPGIYSTTNSLYNFPGNIKAHNTKTQVTKKVWPLNTKLKDISPNPSHWYVMLRNYTGVDISGRFQQRYPPFEFLIPEILEVFDEKDPDSFYEALNTTIATNALLDYWNQPGSDDIFQHYEVDVEGFNDYLDGGSGNKDQIISDFLTDQLSYENDLEMTVFVNQAGLANNYPNSLGWFNWIRVSPGLRHLWPIMIDMYNNTANLTTMYFPQKDSDGSTKMVFHPVAAAFMEMTVAEAIGLEQDRVRKIFPALLLPKSVGVVFAQDERFSTAVVPFVQRFNSGVVPAGGMLGGGDFIGTSGLTTDIVQSKDFKFNEDDKEAYGIYPHFLVIDEIFRDPKAPYNSTDPNKIIDGFSGNSENISDELALFLDGFPNYLGGDLDPTTQASFMTDAYTLEQSDNFNPNILEYKLPFTEIMSKALESKDGVPAIPAQEKSDEIMKLFSSANSGDQLQELAAQLESVNLNRSLVSQNTPTFGNQVWTNEFTKISKFLKAKIHSHKGYAQPNSPQSWDPIVSEEAISEEIYNFNFGSESTDNLDADVKDLINSLIGTPETLKESYHDVFNSEVEKYVDPFNYKAQIFGKFLTSKFVAKFDEYYNLQGGPGFLTTQTPNPEYVLENYENMKTMLNRGLSRYGYSALQYAYSTQVFSKIRNSRLNTREFMKKLWKKVLRSPLNNDIDPRCAELFEQIGAPSIDGMDKTETDFFKLENIKDKIIEFYKKSLCFDLYENSQEQSATVTSLLEGMVTMICKIYCLEMILASLFSWDSVDIVDAFKDKALISIIIQNIEQDYDIDFVAKLANDVLKKQEGLSNIELAEVREANSALEYMIVKEAEKISGIVSAMFINSFPLKTNLEVSLIKNSDPDFLKDFEVEVTSDLDSIFKPTEYKKFYEEKGIEFVLDARLKDNIYTMNYGNPEKMNFLDAGSFNPTEDLVQPSLSKSDIYGFSKTTGPDGIKRVAKHNKNYFHSLPMDFYYKVGSSNWFETVYRDYTCPWQNVPFVSDGDGSQEWTEYSNVYTGMKHSSQVGPTGIGETLYKGYEKFDALNKLALGHSTFDFENNVETTYGNLLNSKLGNILFQPYVRIKDYEEGEQSALDFNISIFSEYDASGAPCVGADTLVSFNAFDYIDNISSLLETARLPEGNVFKSYMYDYVPLTAWNYFYNHVFMKTIVQFSVEENGVSFKPLLEVYKKYGLKPFFKKISFGMRMTYVTSYPFVDEIDVRTLEPKNPNEGVYGDFESLTGDFDFTEFMRNSFGNDDSITNSLRKVKSLYGQRPHARHSGKVLRELQIPVVEIEKELNFIQGTQKFTVGDSDSFDLKELGTTIDTAYAWGDDNHPVHTIVDEFDKVSQDQSGVLKTTTMSEALLSEDNIEIMDYLVNNFQQFYYKNLANELLTDVKSSPEFKLMFDYLFPMKRYMATGVIACSDSISKYIPEPTFVLEDTKNTLQTIINNLLNSADWRNVPSPIASFLADLAVAKEMGTTGKEPNITKEIFKMILRTPLLILKGLVEVTDPAVIVAKLVIDISNAIVFSTLNAIKTAISTAKSIMNTGIQTAESLMTQSEISLSMSTAALPAIVSSLKPSEIQEKITINNTGVILGPAPDYTPNWELEIQPLEDETLDKMTEEEKEIWEGFKTEFNELQKILTEYSAAAKTLYTLKEQKKKLEEDFEEELKKAEEDLKKVYQSPFLLPGLWAALMPPMIPLGGGIIPPPFPGGPFPSTVPGMIYIALLLIDAIEEKTHDDLSKLDDPNCEDQL